MKDVWTYGSKYICIRRDDGRYDRIAETIAGDTPDWDAKAGFLIHAANSHDALVEALKQSAQALSHAGVFIGNPDMGEGPRAVAFQAVVDACAKSVQLLAALETPANPIEEVVDDQR